jgi:hypothetical protein
MTEAEWLASNDPQELLKYPKRELSRRKVRLFAVGCCARAIELFTDQRTRRLLDMTEQFTDGLVTKSELASASQASRGMIDGTRGWFTLPEHAALGLICAASTSREAVGRAIEAAQYVAYALRELPRVSPGNATLVREVFGNPFRPVPFNQAWRTTDLTRLANGIYAEKAFDRMPILADALQDAGCDNADILDHCRGPGPHVRGCWVVDLVLGRE